MFTVAHLGIISFVFLLIAFITGFMRKKLKKRFLVIHKVSAIGGVALSTLHAVLQLSQ